jgi:hypothetical protein
MVKVKMLLSKKGAYAIITAFIFVIIGIVLIMAIIFYQTFVLDLENTAKDDLNNFQIAKDARDRIFYCYGSNINQNKLDETCDIPIIKGYKIEVLEMNGCLYYEKDYLNDLRFKNRYNYAVAIIQEGKTCIGKLQIYI